MNRQFGFLLEKARKGIDEYLSLFPHIKPNSPKYMRAVRGRPGISDVALHRDIKDLYEEVSKEMPSFPKPDADKIKKDLENIMIAAIPRFTAPIKIQE